MQHFARTFADTLVDVATTRVLLFTMVVAVLFYGFFYPAPYAHQAASGVPIVVVDLDRSTLSRALLRNLAAARAVSIIAEAPDLTAAAALSRDREADGIILIEAGLGRSIAGQTPGGVAIIVNGTNPLRAKEIGTALSGAVGGAIGEWIEPLAAAVHAAPPLTIVMRPLFNTRAGYGDYVFPAVAGIIIQQTLLFGAAIWAARRRAQLTPQLSLAAFLGAWAAFTFLGTLTALYYQGVVYWLQDVPHHPNVTAMLLAMPLYAAAVSALGLLIGSCFAREDQPMTLLAPTSLLLFFMSGAAWPLASMPGWVAALAHLSPSTSGIHIFIALGQMGASLDEVTGHLLWLLALSAIYSAAAGWRMCHASALVPKT
ncbi:ABC transporter permease [Polymorphobacter arshaanensis]|uniref:ABC transporter permease n=1 Tax=Glacieibacterium arshaanense TaxID=2511025 RepID=A0A4Y9ERA3_9SPHN|nr:ABC transporter permease [Polymorphobacter arshaanensis]TFU05860.1 ABC transporter permease [Polymorphobacter arshaanensis]